MRAAVLLDGELATLAMAAHGFVYSAIGAAADEAHDAIFLAHFDLARIGTHALQDWSGPWAPTAIGSTIDQTVLS